LLTQGKIKNNIVTSR